MSEKSGDIPIYCTRAYRRTSTDALLEELGWPKLEDRHTYSSQTQFYKIVHKLAPHNLHTLLPERYGRNYPTRRENSYIPIRTRTTRYHNSFVPAAVRKWNSLDNTLQTAPSVEPFQYALRKSMFKKRTDYYSSGQGRAAVSHTRIRRGLSPLKHQLYSHRIVDSPTCTQRNSQDDETPAHYFMNCIPSIQPTDKNYSKGWGRLWTGLTWTQTTKIR